MEPNPFLETPYLAWWKPMNLVAFLPGALLTALLINTTIAAIYNLYFHPLHHIPGPKLWIIFPILRHIACMRGKFDVHIRKFHAQYGPVVRWQANSITFTTAQAWKDIYGHGHPELPKTSAPVSLQKAPLIITASAADHFRYRRALLPAFSESALRRQEPLVKVYVDLLINKLRGLAASDSKADMVKWYNLTTFDVIGDLAFGESFHGLRDEKTHAGIESIEKLMKFFPILGASLAYPFFAKPLMFLVSSRIKEASQKHIDSAKTLTMRRLNNESLHGRGDFMDHMMRSRGQRHGLSDDELASNADILIVAGSETTATLLSGVTYWLLRTPRALAKVTHEVRSSFNGEDEINFLNSTARLPYMLACLDEALRKYPPVPTVLPRFTLPGPSTPIDGYLVPGGTSVGVHQSAAYWSSLNFHLPQSFVPERWLPESTTNPSSPFYNDNREVVKPFSFGPRDCVGRVLAYTEMRLILARVLWNFDLELCEESTKWDEQRSFALWEKPPLWCHLKVRDGF